MKRTGLLYDERFSLHITGFNHPEAPERIEAVYRGVASLLPDLTTIRACRPKLKWIEAVHSPEYIRRFQEACLLELSEFDCPDNQICKDTFETALLAVGGILDTANLMMEGEIDNAFCAVRPPGHHAEVDRALGFCYFNNVAIAARNLQEEWGIERVGIIDFDVHHGNGTQNIFEDNPTVFYYSIHEHPTFSYPGTGHEFEKGSGLGYGYTLNSPVLPYKGDKEYKELLEKDLFPAFQEFKPEVILVSAGFDAHADDNMSSIKLSTYGFSWVMEKIVEMADRYSHGRIISILEGGYSIRRLPELIKNHVEILLGK